jgi:imidazole glycerol-phosphate synthase subunit HisH
MKVTIVDYGAGNLGSVHQAFWLAGAEPETSSNPDNIKQAERIVLPGVGAAGTALECLRALGLDQAMDEVRRLGRPILGICLGLQVMAEEIEEYGVHRGLGWIKGKVSRIPSAPNVRIPHIGWSRVDTTDRAGDLIGTSDRDRYFYFCHSNRLHADEGVAAATVIHGEPFTVAVRFDNVFAVQFHPEKSQLAGQRLINRFLNWSP